MRTEDYLAALAIIASLVTALVTTVATIVATDRQRRRDREADRESKLQEWRLSLVASLIPLLHSLSDRVPGPDATDEEIAGHLARLRSNEFTQALHSVTYIGLVFPSKEAQIGSGYVDQSVANAVLLEESALAEPELPKRRTYLELAGATLAKTADELRQLARQVRGPLPWESGTPKSRRE